MKIKKAFSAILAAISLFSFGLFSTNIHAEEAEAKPIPDQCKNQSAEEELSMEELKECFKSFKQAYQVMHPEEFEGLNSSYEPQMYEPQMKPASYEPQMKTTGYEPQMKPASYEPQMMKGSGKQSYEPQMMKGKTGQKTYEPQMIKGNGQQPKAADTVATQRSFQSIMNSLLRK